MAAQLHQLAQTGEVTAQLVAESMNITVTRQNDGFVSATIHQGIVLALGLTAAFFLWC